MRLEKDADWNNGEIYDRFLQAKTSLLIGLLMKKKYYLKTYVSLNNFIENPGIEPKRSLFHWQARMI